jgi:ElaB/YqjD/DUF883 family membrane-anchored ribosome-binding protein
MDQERDQLREVDDARRRVAEDVRSTVENADVVERTKERVKGRIDDVQGRVEDAKSKVREQVRNLRPLENPLVMLFGGVAVGFLLGMLLPVTSFEKQTIGPAAEEVKGRMHEARHEVMRRGGEVIKETIDAGKDAALRSLRGEDEETFETREEGQA